MKAPKKIIWGWYIVVPLLIAILFIASLSIFSIHYPEVLFSSTVHLDVKITGDVSNRLFSVEVSKGELKKSKSGGETWTLIDALTLIEKAQPIHPEKVLIVGRDGLTAEVSFGDLPGSYFRVVQGHRLDFVSDRFPPSTGIKDIEKIIVITGWSSGNEEKIYGLNILYEDSCSFLSFGRLLVTPSRHVFTMVGESSKNVGGAEYASKIYQSTKLVSVVDLLRRPVQNLAIYTADGDVVYTDPSLDILLSDSGYMLVGPELKLKDPIGIVVNPPLENICDLRQKILAAVSEGKKVMLIYVDAMGYAAYEEAQEAGLMPFTASRGETRKALTVYPPITNVAYASMLAGKPPKYTGVHSRQDRELVGGTIFDYLTKAGKKFVVVEGSVNILDIGGDTILNADLNSDGFVDDEILQAAMGHIRGGVDFILVHFHSYDDMCHKYGPNSWEAKAQLEKIDRWIKDLCTAWKGEVIVFADHGAHKEEEGGDHGLFIHEDMYIPIIKIRLTDG